MTTPRDDIAGLSERLRSPVWNDETMKGWDSWREMIIKNRGSLPRDCFESFLDGIDEERAEAAAKLDALQARVKELEAHTSDFGSIVSTLETRAARLQQERDEAYERANGLIDAISHAEDTLSKHIEEFHDFDYEPHQIPQELSQLNGIQHHLLGSLLDEKGEPIRRLAGPEKEGK